MSDADARGPMRTPRQTLSFTGCRTRASAVARLKAFLTTIGSDAARKFETEALVDGVEIDALDATLEANGELTEQGIDEALMQFVQWLDQECIGPRA